MVQAKYQRANLESVSVVKLDGSLDALIVDYGAIATEIMNHELTALLEQRTMLPAD